MARSSSGAVHLKWTTRSAAAAGLGLLGIALMVLGGPRPEPGWLAVQVDPAGLAFTVAALVALSVFARDAVGSLIKFRFSISLLVLAAVVVALLIGDPFAAAALALVYSLFPTK